MTYRKKDFKTGIDPEKCRRNREDDALQIRKVKRETRLGKKRRDTDRHNYETNNKKIDSVKVNQIYNNDPDMVLNSLKYIRKLSSYAVNIYNDDLYMMGIAPKLVDYLKYYNYPDHQYEAAWILTNMISGDSAICQSIIDNTMVGPYMLTLMKESKNSKLRNQAIWALGNMAGDDKKYRNIIIERGGLDLLVNIIDNEGLKPTEDLKLLVWVLGNFVRKNDVEFTKLVKCILLMKKLLDKCDDEEITKDVIWALSNISQQGKDDELDVFVNMGLVTPKFMDYFKNKELRSSSLRFMGNLIAGSDYTTQAVLDAGFLYHVSFLLDCSNVIKETCWILSNIAAGKHKQIQVFLDNNIMSMVENIIKYANWNIRRECIYIFTNLIANGKPNQVNIAVKQGCLKLLCQQLKTTKDDKMLKIALTAIHNALVISKKLDKFDEYSSIVDDYGLTDIEEIQNHENYEIYTICVDIIEKFFQEDHAIHFQEKSEDWFKPLSDNNRQPVYNF